MADDVVETGVGRVKGCSAGGVVTFRGIPFAETTAGPNRFRPPVPVKPWAGVFDARQYGSSCPQYPEPRWNESRCGEDVLTVNIWAPSDAATGCPVLVFVHGGGYSSGASSELSAYDGAELVRRGRVVVVSFNYRLGVFGFVHLGDVAGARYASSGNGGLLDQVEALRWVRDNIAHFGGDPHNVTIFGQSSGGHAVTTLLAVPQARGLFHRAVAQSGAAVFCRNREHANEVTRILLTELGLSASTVSELHTLSAADLVAAQVRVAVKLGLPPAWLCGPLVDGDVLPRPPAEAVAAGMSADVPLLIGSNGDADAKNFDRDCDNSVLEFVGHKVKGSRAPVFVYRFAYADGTATAPRSGHGMELPFVFGNVDHGDAEAARLAMRMSGALVGFARSGTPDAVDLPPWPPYWPEHPAVMQFDTDCRIVSYPAGG